MACVTQSHPFILRNSLIFILRYLMAQKSDEVRWVSLRSVDDFSVAEVAEKFFNGGGHLNASGGHLDCSMEEAVRITRNAITYFADKLRK